MSVAATASAPTPATARRVGRPALRVFSLEEAAEMVAALREVSAGAVLACVRRAPLSFFPQARQSGDGSWRVPERDVRALLGDVEPAVSARTFARWLELSERTVSDACRSGMLRSVTLPPELTGKRRIPRSEFFRVLNDGLAKPRRSSFFAKEGAKS